MKKPTLDLNGVSTFDFHKIFVKLLLLLEVIQCSEKAIDGEVTIKSFDKIPFLNNFFWETHYMYRVKVLKLVYVLKTKKLYNSQNILKIISFLKTYRYSVRSCYKFKVNQWNGEVWNFLKTYLCERQKKLQCSKHFESRFFLGNPTLLESCNKK